MSYCLSQRSRAQLIGVHPALVAVDERAILRTAVDLLVNGGLRSPAGQTALVEAGASRTLKSRPLRGHAVEVAALLDGRVRWAWPLYPRIAEAFKAAAAELHTPLIWGGDWPCLRDGPHFEPDRRRFP